MGFVKEWKEFALKGNVIDLAVGIIIGLYFGAIVKSLVDDIIMPVLGLLLGDQNLNDRYVVLKDGGAALAGNETVVQARETGAVVLSYGLFLNAIITFLLVTFAVFIMVKWINRMRRAKKAAPADPTEKECPYCVSKIPVKATRCKECTSQLSPAPARPA